MALDEVNEASELVREVVDPSCNIIFGTSINHKMTDSVEVTTLTDGAHMYIAGLKDYGDSIDFTFLYEPTQFATLNALSGDNSWKLSLPDGAEGAIDTTCTFTRECSVRLLGKTYNDAMQYTLSIKPTSEMVWG